MRRVLVALTALGLAAFGAFVLVSYVQNADARAEAGARLVPVLVVASDVPAGTPADQLAEFVSTEEVPARLRAADALDDLAALADLDTVGNLATTVPLLRGEQVRAARFADPAVVLADGAVAPDAGTQEVSLTLDQQRAAGGVLAAGDRVGVFVSKPGLDAATNTPTAVTGLTVGNVLVTRVVGGSADTATDPMTGAVQPVTVTLALTEADAQAVIAGGEQESVWLSLQSKAGPADNSSSSTTTTTGADQ